MPPGSRGGSRWWSAPDASRARSAWSPAAAGAHRRGDRGRAGARRARSVVVADLDLAAAEAVAAELRERRGRWPSTSTDDASVAALYAGVAERHGRVDVCVNNAAILHAEDVDPVEHAARRLAPRAGREPDRRLPVPQARLPHLIAAGGGSIVNMASMTALIGSATPQIAYGAAKGGVVAMTRECRRHLRAAGRAGQLRLPGPDRDAALPHHLRQRPEARPAAAPHPVRPRRAWRRSRRRSCIWPGRVVVRHGTTYVVDGGITVAYTTQGDEQ